MTLDDIKEIIDNKFNTDISKKTRLHKHIEPRFIFYHITYHYYPVIVTYKNLAEITNIKQHGTVMNGIKKCEDWLQTDVEFKRKYDECLSHLLMKFKRIRHQYLRNTNNKGLLLSNIEKRINYLQQKRRIIRAELLKAV